jgi:hypothetical protein
MTIRPPQDVERSLGETLTAIEAIDVLSLPERDRKRLLKRLRDALTLLQDFTDRLDVVQQPPMVLDPHHPDILGGWIAQAMLQQSRHPMSAIPLFYGAGVYAIYYNGPHPAYQQIRGRDTPIYVGKADPLTTAAALPIEQGLGLTKRLSEHAKSITRAANLDIADFECRFLVVTSGQQTSSEEHLLEFFQPVWNRVIKGFGKHGDSAKTRKNQRSQWDTLHPGRGWADEAGNTPNAQTAEQLIEKIRGHFAAHPPRA